MMKVFLLGSGPDGNRNKTGCGSSPFLFDALTFPSQRTSYIQSIPARESVGSGYTTSTPRSGYQSPRETKEEQWRSEAQTVSRPSKGDMREMYKELGGRKSKGKAKVGGTGRVRDKGGLGGHEEW